MNKGEPLRELHLFAGAGGGILGGMLLGHVPVCAVEIEEYPRSVLLARQRDGILPRFPIWDDICTFDGRPWRGRVDIVCGGFPCQDISAAGRGAGLSGERSGLWSEMARVVGEVRPRYVFVENSPVLTSRGLGVVLGDLAELGYDARWGVVSAADAGAPHLRKRLWIVAISRHRCRGHKWPTEGREESSGERTTDTDQAMRSSGKPTTVADAESVRLERGGPCTGRKPDGEATCRGWTGDGRGPMADSDCGRCEEQRECVTVPAGVERKTESIATECGGSGEGRNTGTGWWESEPDVGRVAHGVASRVDRLKAIGNGQVPAVAALAWEILSENTPAHTSDQNAERDRVG